MDPYEIFITRDGSPTLILTDKNGYQEKMHHSGGARSESFYIYHFALEQLLQRRWPARILSLGLGLAYNELIAIGRLSKAGEVGWKIWSFECEEFLRLGFLDWLRDRPHVLSPVLDHVLAVVAETLQMAAPDLQAATLRAFESGQLEIRASFPESANDLSEVTCVFFDAFSKKMSPELWSEPSLEEELRAKIAERCVLTTYAATGTLNRALKALSFEILRRPGFAGKRESTLAIRDLPSAKIEVLV